MNKKLFEKVKGLCKDTGLSEKYLKAITEKMGGSIEDDSTDDEAIESTANLIAEVAKESQGEATRWANKNKETKTEEEKKAEEERKKKEEEERLKGKVALDEATEKRLKEMEEKIANYEAKERTIGISTLKEGARHKSTIRLSNTTGNLSLFICERIGKRKRCSESRHRKNEEKRHHDGSAAQDTRVTPHENTSKRQVPPDRG